ncbi:MAG: hypothetical protein L0Y62_03110, partial [Nitrospirae bacterium]|nr:hypothetical protein [Nitrospirota bacterium]
MKKTILFLVALLFTYTLFNADGDNAPKAAGELLQFNAKGHIIGFKPDSMYLVNMGSFLKVEFIGSKETKPMEVRKDRRTEGQKELQELGAVEYRNLWEGITLRYETTNDGIAESTYEIKPLADVSKIRLRYNADAEIQTDGSLRLKLPTQRGYMTESKPIAWQEIQGKRKSVEVSFKITGDGREREIGFRVGEYDKTHALIIDPTLQWHTFYGSIDNDYARGTAIDNSGNVYVTGGSNDTWTGPNGELPINNHTVGPNYDVVILKLDSNGNYIWHTFYGSAQL